MAWLKQLRSRVAKAIAPAPRHDVQFKGASFGRLTADWIFSPITPDAQLASELYTLRLRSRELIQNNAWANRYVALAEANIVGPKGVILQAKTGNTGVDTRLEEAWARWGRQVTTDGKWGWLEVLRLATATEIGDGEVFVRLRRGYDNDFGFALQFIDADALDTSYNFPAQGGGNEIRCGVEIDSDGRAVAYHFFKQVPGDLNYATMERQRIPAEEIVHYYRPFRLNATRGVPRLYPVMYDMNMLRGYQEAELVAARLAAAKTGFFEAKADDGVAYGTDKDTLEMDAEPGSPQQLPVGWTFNEWSPDHPTTAYPDFVAATLRSIASGLDISYMNLTSDLTRSNFASSRVGLLAERDSWRGRQQHLIAHFIEPIFAVWVEMAILSGELSSSFKASTYIEKKQWQARGWTWVDPLKDVQAAVMAKKHRITSGQKIAASMGDDLVDIYDDHAREKEISEETGIPVTGEGEETQPGQEVEPAEATSLAIVND